MSSILHESRMRRFQEAGLYLVTSQALSRGRSTLEIVGAALTLRADRGARIGLDKHKPESNIVSY